jgi:hypothetical protein
MRRSHLRRERRRGRLAIGIDLVVDLGRIA